MTTTLAGSIPSSLGSLTSLESLWLERNNLTGTIPSQLDNAMALTGTGPGVQPAVRAHPVAT